MNNIFGIIRLVLSIALLFGAYTETGKWTTLALALILAYVELAAFEKRNNAKG